MIRTPSILAAAVLATVGGCSAPTSTSAPKTGDVSGVPAPETEWRNPTVPASACGLSVIRWYVDDSLRAALRADSNVEFVSEDELLAQLAVEPDGTANDPDATDADDVETESDEERSSRAYHVAIEDEIFRPDVADVVRTHAEWRPDDAERFAALYRNGIAVARIPVSRMPALITELGAVRRAVRSWQGQAPDWRDLSTQSNDGRVRGVAVDGRVQRFAGGSFKLQFRGWLMPMEDGPRMQFELRGAFAERLAPQAFRQNITERITAFDGAHAEALLEPGYVYVLAAIRPGEVWRTRMVTRESGSRSDRATSMPLRLGPLLLDGAERGIVRELILIEPCVPDALRPPDAG